MMVQLITINNKMIDLDNCERYDAGTFVGYLIGIVPAENQGPVPRELRSYNNLTNYLDNEDRIKITEKRRIVDTFGGRMDRFTMASCETVDKYKYSRYMFIVGEFPKMFTQNLITDLIYLVGSGYPFMVRYDEVPNDSLPTLGQYFNIMLYDDESFGIMSLRDMWWLTCARALAWPFLAIQRLWWWMLEDD